MKSVNWISILKILVGLFFIVIALYAYEWNMSIELTFISNLIAGLVLIIDGSVCLSGRGTPHALYGLVLPCLSIVFLMTTLGTISDMVRFNFEGGFMFLHGINPIIFLLVYLFGTDALRFRDSSEKKRRIIICPILTSLYLLFDIIFRAVNGHYIYGAFDDDFPMYMMIIAAIVVYLISMLLYCGLMKLKTIADTATGKSTSS